MLGRLLEDCPEGWDAALSPDALDALATRAGTPVEEATEERALSKSPRARAIIRINRGLLIIRINRSNK